MIISVGYIISFLSGCFCMAFVSWFLLRNLKREKLDLSDQLRQSGLDYTRETTRLDAALQYKTEELRQEKEEAELRVRKLEAEFRVLASTIMEEQSQRMHERQNEKLQGALSPLKEQIQLFRNEYEARRNKEAEERGALTEQLRNMAELNQTLSAQAERLTEALRGNIKQQGNWGEMILETILEFAGLQKGIHYASQAWYKGENGKTLQPDIVVFYPGERSLIIDAKVSLRHFEQLHSATDPESQVFHEREMINSFKKHIDGLSGKVYQQIPDTLDFVMMFVPVEGAYIWALQKDPGLWQYAYQRNILLISPTNLIAAMKLVGDMWQRDRVNREAHKIAERAGRLYDKLVLFVENLERVGSQLDKARDVYQDAYKQLYNGRGNIISQAERLKDVGALSLKSLPRQ